MNIYIDIDGTMIHEDLTANYGKAAAGLERTSLSLFVRMIPTGSPRTALLVIQ